MDTHFLKYDIGSVIDRFRYFHRFLVLNGTTTIIGKGLKLHIAKSVVQVELEV